MTVDTPLHIVLVDPEIPGNTGNVARTCVGLGARLHLVGRLGFSLDDRHLKRAGLDYWPRLLMTRHESWEAFLAAAPAEARMHFFTTRGARSFRGIEYRAGDWLVFGSESRGFPEPFYERYADRLVRIPVSGGIRSLNLATAVGVAAFEAVRGFEHAAP